ncbi:hypothetical protein CHUAL_004804 [Chamberlinius hualienensis]
MNGDIPSVPITTLAGISSLTDLLPELPLPSPLPSLTCNRNLLFHPRVAEEAKRLLNLRDEPLANQLIAALTQTSTDYIELKDNYAGGDCIEGEIPELLKAILQKNPNTLTGVTFPGLSSQPSMPPVASAPITCYPHPSSYAIPSPYPSPHFSPYSSQPSPSRYTPQCSPARYPQLVDSPGVDTKPRPTFEINGGVTVKAPQKLDPLSPPTAPVLNSTVIKAEPISNSCAYVSNATTAVSSNPLAEVDIKPSLSRRSSVSEPIVVLNKLTREEQALAQKSIRQFNLKTPLNSGQTGAVVNDCIKVNASPKNSVQATSNKKRPTIDSDSDSNEPLATAKNRDGLHKTKIDGRMDSAVTSLTERVKKRKRSSANRSYTEPPEISAADNGDSYAPEKDITCPSPQSGTKKITKDKKKKLIHEENLTSEELMETNTFKRFTNALDMIFEMSEDLDLTAELDEDAEVPPETLIPKYQLAELCGEAAKLKTLGAMDKIPIERLVRLLTILERNIRDGAKLIPIESQDDQDEDEGRLWLELAMERVTRSVDASLTAIYAMTSPNMHKQVYLEDVIERVVSFTKYQLQNTIFPVFDPVYRVDSKNRDGYIGNIKQKRARAKEVKHKAVLQLYNKLNELVGLLAELLDIQTLTDTTVLQVSTLGVSPFFVEGVSELQLSTLRLVTTVFAKYEKHRQLILEDILASLARLPTSKRSLRNYRLNSEEHIQMVTALILQLIQCVVQLPKLEQSLNLPAPSTSDKKAKPKPEIEKKANVDNDVLIVTSYEMAMQTAANFLSVFLKKCSGKSDELDYRPLFENMVQDLLLTVNKPEWPAAELLLSILGRLLVQNFSNKALDMSLRVASLDYLGAVAAKLRRDSVSSQLKQDSIDELVKQLTVDSGDDSPLKSKNKKVKPSDSTDKTHIIQLALVSYLQNRVQSDPSIQFAMQFYIAQWYRDASKLNMQNQGKNKKSNELQLHGKLEKPTTPIKDSHHHQGSSGKTPSRNAKSLKRKRKYQLDSSDEDEEEEEEENSDNEQLSSPVANFVDKDALANEALRIAEKRKEFLLNTIRTCTNSSTSLIANHKTYKLDYESADLVTRFLASKRPFSQSFDIYLTHILRVLNESAIAVRTKAMKCLASVVEADPGILARVDMQSGVHGRFLDASTSVREAAVDLVGKFILVRPELTHQYYDMLIERILDTGVSVRKRVIKILKDICIEQPEFDKIPEICVKMIRRVNDEEGIKKLVNEVFQNMWFTSVKERDVSKLLIRKVMNITDVVFACKDKGLDWFEQLLQNLLKCKEKEDISHQKQAIVSCKQIVDCLVENVLRLEESSLDNKEGGSSSHRLVSCLTTLHLFAKIQPTLLVPHAMTLQPYLSLKCSTTGDYLVLTNVAKTLELVVPLIEHPSETFLAQLEENMIKLILRHGMTVVQSCISCLGAIVNNVTKNYKLVWDCFQKFFEVLVKYKWQHCQNPDNPALASNVPALRRSLFTVGHFCRYFDFEANCKNEYTSQGSIKERLFECLMYFVRHPDENVKSMALTSLGSLCIRHYELMLGKEVKSLYNEMLTKDDAVVTLKCQVLKNIQTYLQEEEIRMIKQDSEWAKRSKKEDLKEMGDVTSGMASTIIQIYLKQILESYMHHQSNVRMAVIDVIQLILSQGLVHPVQIVPYLICMSTDSEQSIRVKSDNQLKEIEKKYPGFIQMKSIAGVKMSYRLQKIAGQDSGLTRGYRLPTTQGESIVGLNSHLYAVVRSSRQHRRAFILSLLKQFDEQVKTPLHELLYLADNLAYFPFQMQDEPLFLVHHIDVFISVTGSNLLQTFREMASLRMPPPTVCSEGQNSILSENSIINAQNVEMSMRSGLPFASAVTEADLMNNDMQGYYQSELTNSQKFNPTQGLLSSANPSEPKAAAKPEIEDDDEDIEDVDYILSRLPENVLPLQDCMNASQGCLLLLLLKQHLKEMYGLTDGKIRLYSPAEQAKVFEKTISRRTVAPFMPKVTLDTLGKGSSPIVYSVEDKRNLVQQYLEFKDLMLSIDRAEEEDDPDFGQLPASAKNKALSPRGSIASALSNHTAESKEDLGITVISPAKAETVHNKTLMGIEMAAHITKRKSSVGNSDVHKSRSRVRTPKPKDTSKKKVKKKRRKVLDSEDDDDGSDPDFTG